MQELDKKYKGWINEIRLLKSLDSFNQKKSPSPNGLKPAIFEFFLPNLVQHLVILYKAADGSYTLPGEESAEFLLKAHFLDLEKSPIVRFDQNKKIPVDELDKKYKGFSSWGIPTKWL